MSQLPPNDSDSSSDPHIPASVRSNAAGPPIHGEQSGNRFGQQVPPALFHPPKKSNEKLLVLVGLAALLGVLMCGGMLAWVAYSFQSPSRMTAEYRENRDPIGGEMPPAVREKLAQGSRARNVEPEIQQLLDEIVAESDIAETVDLSRFAQEMQASGEAVGVNRWTRLFWIENLRSALSLPGLSNDLQILSFEWLKQGQEARVTVASYWGSFDMPEVWLLYVIKSADGWKLYDWRDVLEATSETQYYALYSAADLSVQDNFSEFTFEAQEIYYDDDVAWEEKARKTLALYQQRRYPAKLVPLAQSCCAYYLGLYEAGDELAVLLRGISGNRFAGAHYFRGQLALMNDNRSEAFRRAQMLNKAVGWHPAAAILAGKAAQTDEEKKQAIEWLTKSVTIAPFHYESLDLFLGLAERSDVRTLLDRIAGNGSPVKDFVDMVDALELEADDELIFKLAEVAAEIESLGMPADYGVMRRAVLLEDHQETLRIAVRLLNDSEFAKYHELVWPDFVSAALREGQAKEAMEMVLDQKTYLTLVRDQVVQRWPQRMDWEDVLSVLKGIPEEYFLADDMESQIAIARCECELEQWDASLNRLFPMLDEEGVVLLGSNPPDCAETFFLVAARAAIESNQIQDFKRAVADTEVSYVVLASLLDEDRRYDQLEELTQWYRDEEGPRVWGDYYEARGAYSRGDWAVAEAAYARCSEEAEYDSRFEDFAFPHVVAQFCPDMDGLLEERISVAIRTGRFKEFLTQARNDETWDAEWRYSIDWELGDFKATEIAAEIAPILMESNDFDLRQFGRELRSEAYLADGKNVEAIDVLLQAAREASLHADESVYSNNYVAEVAQLMAATLETAKLPQLRLLAAEPSDQRWVESVAALARKDGPRFVELLKQRDVEYEALHWSWEPALLDAQQRSGVWAAANAEFPADVSAVMNQYSSSGVILLDASLEEIFDSIAVAFEKGVELKLEPWDATLFPNAHSVWSAETEQGRLVCVGYIEHPESARSDSELGEFLSRYSSTLCVALLRRNTLVEPYGFLRKVVARVGSHLPAAVGYRDIEADSLFAGKQWQDQLQLNANTGVNSKTPIPQYLGWHLYESELFSEDPAPMLRVDVGLMYESVSVEVESVSDDSRIVKLNTASLLLPCLPKGARVEIFDSVY